MYCYIFKVTPSHFGEIRPYKKIKNAEDITNSMLVLQYVKLLFLLVSRNLPSGL